MTSGGNGWCDGQGASQCPNPNSLGRRRAGLRLHRRRGRRRGRPGLRRSPRVRRPDRRRRPHRDRHVRQDRAGGPTSTAPTTVTEGVSVKFTAKVTDPFPGGFAAHYAWNWGDGSTSTTTTNSASHTYKTTGTHTIKLTVTDNYLGTGTAAHGVKVNK